MANGKKWMKKAFGEHPGLLHSKLHVTQGQKIPAKKLAKAAKSGNPTLRREVALAKTGEKFGGHKSGQDTMILGSHGKQGGHAGRGQPGYDCHKGS